jgi:hypothetical protein
MPRPNVYVDLDGREMCLEHLDAEERKLLARLRQRARTNPDWDEFDNYWTREVQAFYQARGVARKAVPRTILWRIGADLSGRIALTAGMARNGDYRDDLEELVREKFRTRRAFCEATGISEEMLSQLLAGRTDLSLKSFAEALERIGYALRIEALPAEETAAAASGRVRTG